MAIAIVEELWTRIRAAIDDKIVAATDARDQAVAAAVSAEADAAQTGMDSTAAAADSAHVDAQIAAIDTAFTESVPPYLQQDSPGGLNKTYAARGRVKPVFTPEEFGAVADGVTDDTAAIQAAVNAARDAGGGTVFFQSGKTYSVLSVKVGGGITLEGYGATMIRPPMTPNWTRMITNQGRSTAGQADSESAIVVRGIKFDGNLANQGEYEAYQQEQSSLLFFMGSTTVPGRERVIIEDAVTVGSVSDGIHIVNDVDATIRNHIAVDCFRGGLVMSGGNSRILVQGFKSYGKIEGANLDAEIDSPGYGGSWRTDITINDWVELDASKKPFQLTGYAGSVIRVANSQIMSGLHIYGGTSARGTSHVSFHACEIYTESRSNLNTLWSTADIQFFGCSFYFTWVEGTARDCALHLTFDLGGEAKVDSRVLFRDCDFTKLNASPGKTPAAIQVNSFTTTGAGKYSLTFEGGSIGAGFEYGVECMGGGNLEMRSATVGAKYPIKFEGNSSSPVSLILDGLVYTASVSNCLYSRDGHAANVVEHRNTYIPARLAGVYSVTWGDPKNTYLGSRVIMLDGTSPVAIPGLMGDRARVKSPVAGGVYEWVCTKTGRANNAQWVPAVMVPA